LKDLANRIQEIDPGADIEQRDGNGLTAIELALWWGFGKTGTKLDKVARRFCERGASLSSLDSFECRNYGNEACYCEELIPELFAIQDRRKKAVVTSDSLHSTMALAANGSPPEEKIELSKVEMEDLRCSTALEEYST